MDHHKYCYRRERESSNPSFSSTLLDAIYRSIDEAVTQEAEEELVLYKETMRTKHNNISSSFKADHDGFQDEIDMANFQRACLIEKWMEKKKVVVRRNSAPEAAGALYNSSSSSSDSSSGGGFSSSEAETTAYAVSSCRSSCYGLHKPKPIRTSISAKPDKYNMHHGHNYLQRRSERSRDYAPQPKAKQEGGFVKTKSRALKIYSDLKKVKQPISPGGRLASFLNYIFTARNAKKAKISSNNTRGVVYDDATSERKLKSANSTSTCSSASSFSRSCLSKSTTPSSRGKSSVNGMKRSVQFYPVSVIVDEDCQPCGQKSLYDDDKPNMDDLDIVKNINSSSINEELKFHAMEKNRRVEEAARELLRNFQKKVDRQCDFDMRNARSIIKSQVFEDHVDGEEDDDDAASYASSDLFELDNLSAIGMDQRYREELPVYETTHLDTNRAIANGMIL